MYQDLNKDVLFCQADMAGMNMLLHQRSVMFTTDITPGMGINIYCNKPVHSGLLFISYCN
jgi:hypothetical protein